MAKNLIAVSAKIGGGKDTFFDNLKEKSGKSYENKKFAGKLKQIASLLIGVPVEKFEDNDFKNKTFEQLYEEGVINKNFFDFLDKKDV